MRWDRFKSDHVKIDQFIYKFIKKNQYKVIELSHRRLLFHISEKESRKIKLVSFSSVSVVVFFIKKETKATTTTIKRFNHRNETKNKKYPKDI